MKVSLPALLALLAILPLAAPAQAQAPDLADDLAEEVAASAPGAHDPWIRINRNTYAFNDDLDRAVLKPLAKAYQFVTHRDMRRSVGNFLNNLEEPGYIIWNLSQGKFLGAFISLLRFIVNSTLGVFGLFDPATPMGLRARPEDFGQTLGAWGLGAGPYFVIPFLGPSTLRDALGSLPGYLLEYGNMLPTSELSRRLFLLDLVSFREGLLGVGDLASSYQAQRDAWLSQREWQVKDGKVEAPALDEDLLDLFDDLDEEGLDDFDDTEEEGGDEGLDDGFGDALFLPQMVPLAFEIMSPQRRRALMLSSLEFRAERPPVTLRLDLLVQDGAIEAAGLHAPDPELERMRAEHWVQPDWRSRS